ncbi:MAG: TM2 domain-containing protein [Bacteroidales bacterium]|nr:TM2 domain-containing protein [Bacteroidales bacterium]
MNRNIILMLFAFVFSVNTTFAENKSSIEGNKNIEMQQRETESIKVEMLDDDEHIKESLISNFATTYQKCFTQSDFNMVIAFLRTKSVEEIRMITSSFSGIDPNVTQIVSIFLGAYGVDRFMLGQNTYGAIKLITFGGCGIWAIIDWFQIKRLTKETNMKNFAEITNMNQFALTQQGYYPPVPQQEVKKTTNRKQLAKEEPRKEVEGYGNTALENTIVRWDVQSRPAGADVFWRVVSKTPEVKSTNNKYLQTTPYEATKSLDIRGLSYENSGDVRIILRCEKEGYYPQEKEFNVRMIIDQEEISAFFRLVKEE